MKKVSTATNWRRTLRIVECRSALLSLIDELARAAGRVSGLVLCGR